MSVIGHSQNFNWNRGLKLYLITD